MNANVADAAADIAADTVAVESFGDMPEILKPHFGKECTEVPGKYFQFVDEDMWTNFYQYDYHNHFKELRGEQANKYRMDVLSHNDVYGFDTDVPQCMIIRSKNPRHKVCYISNKTIREMIPR